MYGWQIFGMMSRFVKYNSYLRQIILGMNWVELTNLNQLDEIDNESKANRVLIFKHSTRCGRSAAVLERFKRGWNAESKIKTYYLDLLKHRDISNAIAERYAIQHESPQVLVISDGKCVFNESDLAIQVSDILVL